MYTLSICWAMPTVTCKPCQLLVAMQTLLCKPCQLSPVVPSCLV